MEFIAIMTAVIAGWGIRKKASEINRIRKQNRRRRAARKRQNRHRAKTWEQVNTIYNDYAEAVTCCG